MCFGSKEKSSSFRVDPVEDKQSFGFIEMRDGQLYERGHSKPFRWLSFNVPNLLLLEDRPGDTLYGFPICQKPVESPTYDPNGYGYGMENDKVCIIPKFPGEVDPTIWVPPTPDEQEDAILTVKGAEGKVIRTYTLGFGSLYHVQAPGDYYEPAWVAFDHALALARKHKIRLIIPIINNHNGGDSSPVSGFGDYSIMCSFRNLKSSDFYRNPILRQDLKDIIQFMLNRTNTVNGIRYSDDETILAWQLGNELGGWDGPSPPDDWIIDIASFIKSIAKNTLVMDGCQGGLEPIKNNRWSESILKHDSVDIFTNHFYHGPEDYNRIKKQAEFIFSFKKPLFLGEFGFHFKSNKGICNLVLNNEYICGANVWSLRYHSRDGGFYVHGEEGGFFSYHAPGFNTKAYGFGVDDDRMVKMMREHALILNGEPKTKPFPFPPAAKACDGQIEFGKLRWFGSAWASGYQIERSDGSEPTKWIVLSTFCTDCVPTGKVLFNDSSAIHGNSYCYRIKPISVEGQINHLDPLILKN